MIREERIDGTCVLTLDNPPVNALGVSDYSQLVALMTSLAEDADVAAVVITGAGGRVFCAGQDVKDIAAFSPAASKERKRLLVAAMTEVLTFPKPTVAAVNGHAVGAGLMLASVCDTAVSVPDATLRLTEIDVGVVGGARHAMRVLPPAVVRHMVLTGAALGAERARELGAFAATVAPDRLLNEALDLARTLASKEPGAYRMWKEALLSLESASLNDGWALERRSSLALERQWDARRRAGGGEKSPAGS